MPTSHHSNARPSLRLARSHAGGVRRLGTRLGGGRKRAQTEHGTQRKGVEVSVRIREQCRREQDVLTSGSASESWPLAGRGGHVLCRCEPGPVASMTRRLATVTVQCSVTVAACRLRTLPVVVVITAVRASWCLRSGALMMPTIASVG
eukprot:1553229-Rhodomonas_salina.1